MPKVTCFGEIMLRLSPPNYQRLIQTRSLDMNFGGSEANVAVSLSQLGTKASFVSRVPDNPIGDACINSLRGLGVGTDAIIKGGERLGVYFIEHGASLRASKVIYDRRNSAFSGADPAEFNWSKILNGSDWLHISGITPALGPNPSIFLSDAIRSASAQKVAISFDINYRSSLWSIDKASQAFDRILNGIDVLICGESDLNTFFKTNSGSIEDSAAEIRTKYGLKLVAVTRRQVISASTNIYQAFLLSSDAIYHSRTYEFDIVDRVGSGDAFTAGLIHGLKNGFPLETVIEFAVANSVVKNTIPGDFCLATENEISSMIGSKNPGTIIR